MDKGASAVCENRLQSLENIRSAHFRLPRVECLSEDDNHSAGGIKRAMNLSLTDIF